ncbi:MAG: 4'-phosphopantetheinyl transferase superfamily protein [Azospirillum sp.]|nr:4'-phosphopantetheinyl transferase superfamily protein [Azospirillum sp.]
MTGRAELAPGQIAVWFRRVPSLPPGADPKPPDCLDAGERARWARFHFPADRALYGAAHALLRAALSHYAAIAPADWRFRVLPGGRPELAGAGAATGLRFSLSHTQGLCACAVARGLSPGIDAAARDASFAALEFARDVFHPEEIAVLANTPSERRTRAIFDLWALKEAYAKARGRGLALPFDSFIARLDPPGYRPDAEASSSVPWHARLLELGEAHSLAVAAQYPTGVTVFVHDPDAGAWPVSADQGNQQGNHQEQR